MHIQNKHLPRLSDPAYQGFSNVFWTQCIQDRKRGWLTTEAHRGFREYMLHTMARYHLICPVYILMPDHLHWIWMGIHSLANQRKAIRFFKRYWAKSIHPFRLQCPAYDHVLRQRENLPHTFMSTCHYITENPIRAGLTEIYGTWPYTGCIVPGYPDIEWGTPDFWDKFWKIHTKIVA